MADQVIGRENDLIICVSSPHAFIRLLLQLLLEVAHLHVLRLVCFSLLVYEERVSWRSMLAVIGLGWSPLWYDRLDDLPNA